MKKFNPDLQKDILQLSELKKTSPGGFKKKMEELTVKHGLSRSTIYRELAKPEPGSYRSRKHEPSMSKITNLELDRVAEMMVARKSDTEMLSEMSAFKNFDYSEARLAKAKQKIRLAAHFINNPKPKVVHHIYDPKIVDGMKISKVEFIRADGKEGLTPKDPMLPCYEGNASKFFYSLAGIDTSDPDGIQKISFPNGEVHYVNNSVIKSSLDHISGSSLAGGRSNEDSLNFAIDSLLRNQLTGALRRGYITPLELRQLASTRKVLTQIRNEASPAGGSYSFEEVMHIVGVFSPSTSRENVARIIASHPFLDRTRSKAVPAYEPAPVSATQENSGEAYIKTTEWEEGGSECENNNTANIHDDNRNENAGEI